ncbi:hypothetical protein [Carboxylicivirga caseinilyticus]|uniref:hypothetical protein n=1 Tax=Carboxylicivirga caseinilyticus TaxID=3417572 RepID=UPI003D35954C|nr:hypothetical protein [Marinilabiliaceae bacterium A049]
MKRLSLKILFFVSVFVLFNYTYMWYLKRYDFELSKALMISKMKNQKFDCIFLGNSVSFDGIDSEFFTKNGVSAYNFALGGANIEASYIQLSNYLKTNTTKCVMLGLSPGVDYKNFTPPPLHPAIEYSYDLMDKFSIRSIPVIKFQWLAVEIVKKVLSKDHREARIVMGQLRTKKTVPDHTDYSQKTKTSISICDFEKAKFLFKMDSLCDVNKIDFVLIGMPGYKNTQNDIDVGLHILEYNGDNKLHYLNLNNAKQCTQMFDSTDWLGNSHLNEYGAKKLTEFLYNLYNENSFH